MTRTDRWTAVPSPTHDPWETAGRPDRRLRLLVGLTALPLLAVLFRLGDLLAGGGVTSGVSPTRSVLEAIPARDGRILSSDGVVLAEDVETFSILLHYRWLERPANPDWLRREALQILSPAERRNREVVIAAEQRIISRREALWESLADTAGTGRPELLRRFAAIQERVESLRRIVEAARTEPPRDAPSPPAETWWQAVWNATAEAVTTPPRREHSEPLVLAEELDRHEIASGLPITVAAAIEASLDRFPGTRVTVGSRRRYPHGATAAHLIGYRFPQPDSPSGSDAQEASRGQTGVERTYDRHLRGVDGIKRVWTNRRGETVRTAIVREPRVGRDIVLHLDLGLQLEVERRLDDAVAAVRNSSTAETPVPSSAGGCVIAIDVRTGAVLAAASAPRFDLGLAASRDADLWQSVLTDTLRPLFDRVCSAAVPPGSVFKPVTAVALLDSGRIDPDAPFDCVGYLDRPERHRDYIYRHFGVGHGPTTLTSALAESCNVYFFHAARVVGARPLLTWAERFGFGRETGIDLPAEAAGNLPDDPRGTDPLGLSIGQADLTATPLQIVRMTAAIANGGRLVTPHVVRGSGPARQGDDPARPVLRTEDLEQLPPDTLARIHEGLEQAISHPRGTGYKTVRHPQVTIAGKTGTAEVGGDRPDHAWFAGYAPADDPQVALVVLLEHAGSGSQAAGPLAKATVDALLHRGLLRP